MKKTINLICMLVACVICFASVACEGGDTSSSGSGEVLHAHSYVEVPAVAATCENEGNSLYYKCDCGKVFLKMGDVYAETELSKVIKPKAHSYKYIPQQKATCEHIGSKAHAVCKLCGRLFVNDGTKYVEVKDDDLILEKIRHEFVREEPTDEYRVSEATENSPAVFVKSCSMCGLTGNRDKDTFTHGKSLAEYRAEGIDGYIPRSLTVSLYDAQNCVYGFSWNEDSVPARPVLEIKEVGAEGDYRIVGGSFKSMKSYEYTTGDRPIDIYYIKAEIKLNPSSVYEYRVGDKYLNTYTEYAQITAVDPAESGAWRFVHVSDSQVKGSPEYVGTNSGLHFQYVLKEVDKEPSNRFILHTGDVVEYSKYESYWTNMLDYNAKYLGKIPIMALSGNHETTYRNGSNETFKHFNYLIPEQSTEKGFYYSFSYGGVKFIMLNTNVLTGSSLALDQYNWLENELKNKTEKWTIVSMHNPIYSPGKWGSNPDINGIALGLKSQLAKLFADYKVDLVLQGHDHMISRTHAIGADGKPVAETTEKIGGIDYSINPQGVIYLENGPAGNQSGRAVVQGCDMSLYSYALAANSSSWAEIEINGEIITVYVKYVSAGSAVTQKTWGIKKAA